MKKFKLKANFSATNDQNNAISKLVKGVQSKSNQVLLGVTGSGKTFTVANTIEKLNRPTLIISHNKTLAAQLYQEFRDFFPENAVSYFVSYYDYYQPEAYIPSTDTYIEKDAGINELIDKLRLSTTTNLLTRKDVIVIASVSCIYNIGSPSDYGKFAFEFATGVKLQRKQILDRLIDLQYERSEFGFHRGTFRVRGNTIDVYLAYEEVGIRIEYEQDTIKTISKINPVTGKVLEAGIRLFTIYPAKHFVTDSTKEKEIHDEIRNDLNKRVKELNKAGKKLEAHRLKQRVTYDLEMLAEMGYVKGIENYSRYFDGRKPGEAPYALLEYFKTTYKDDWLVVVDESHITFPQIRGMYAGDRSRKQTLIDYGFRLPAAIDNRPLTFDEFMRKIPMFLATSATPSDWELSMSKNNVVEQLLRPTGIPDPEVDIRPTSTQVADVYKEIKKRANIRPKANRQRTLVTTLTKRTAEDLSEYLKEKGLKVHYLHSDVKTLERTDILDDLRKGNYDCLVGINLLREGLDLPEVSLVAILDADKEGFLRSDTALVQTMGRAARHSEGKVILYADRETGSIKRALREVGRRREYQLEMNKKLGITPKSIQKPIRKKLIEFEETQTFGGPHQVTDSSYQKLAHVDIEAITPMEKRRLVKSLNREMRLAANDLNFELAAEIRDKIKELT